MDGQGVPLAAKQCRVIATFHNQCYAASLDPNAGTPGAGWAIAADNDTAEARALAHCKLPAATAPNTAKCPSPTGTSDAARRTQTRRPLRD